MSEIQDMLLDKTYSGIEIINLIESLDIIEILANPMIDSIVSNMYVGPYERELFLRKSTCFKVIEEEILADPGSNSVVTKSFRIFEYGNCLYSLKKQLSQVKMLSGCKNARNQTFFDEEGSGEEVGHMFQFKIWKRSLDVKIVSNLLLILIISILLQVYSFLLVRQMQRVTDQKTVIDALESAGTDTVSAYQVLDNLSNDFYQYSVIGFILNVCTVGYLIQDFQTMIYLKLRGVYSNPYNFLFLMNLISTIMWLVWVILYYTKYATDFGDTREEAKAALLIQRMKDDENWNYKVSIALPVAIQFARLVYALQVNRTFGPMVKIISTMTIDVIIFLVLFAALFFIFVGSGQILFAELDEFKDLQEAMKTLFASSIGEFDYAIYDNLSDVDPRVGYIFITVFIIIASIMLLNFLIAILSTTYSALNEVKNGLYMRKVIQYRQKYNYNQKYSSIVYAPVPLNLLILPFIPLIIWNK